MDVWGWEGVSKQREKASFTCQRNVKIAKMARAC